MVGLTNTAWLAVNGDYLYMTREAMPPDVVTKCFVTANGGLENCLEMALGLSAYSGGITFNKESDFYVHNVAIWLMAKCSVKTVFGELESCTNSGATGLNGPVDVTATQDAGYITNGNQDTVIRCLIQLDDIVASWLDSCASGLSFPYGR